MAGQLLEVLKVAMYRIGSFSSVKKGPEMNLNYARSMRKQGK